MLQPGSLLADAKRVLPELQAEGGTRDLAAMVNASLTADWRKRQLRTTILSTVSIVLLMFALGAGYESWQARISEGQARSAEGQARSAQENAERSALAEREAALEADRQRNVAEAATARAVESANEASRRQAEAERSRAAAEEQQRRAEQAAIAEQAATARAEQQRATAEAATRRAEQNFGAAEQAVSTLVFDLAQKLRTRIGMPADMVRDILDLTDRALAGLERAAPDEPRVRRLRAAAL